MSEKEKPRELKSKAVRPAPGPLEQKAAAIRTALAEARQRVKPFVKLEREGQQVPSDLLNLRLKSNAGNRS